MITFLKTNSNKRQSRLAPFLLGLVLAVSAWAEIPTVKLENIKPLGGGVSETFSGEIEGQRWFFKKDAPIMSGAEVWLNYGNFEAEIIAAKLFTDFGYKTPIVRVVNVEGLEGQYLQAEWVDEAFTSGHKMVGIYEVSSHPAGIDEDRARLLLVLDAFIANGDRHQNNIFFIVPEGEKAVPIPIDHNLALATRNVVATGDWQLNFHRSFKYMDRFTERNNLYRKLANSEGSRLKFIEIARQVKMKITDDYLIELVELVDDKVITFGDPQQRKDEILVNLQARRDRIVSAFERTTDMSDRKHDPALETLDAILAEVFGGRLRLSSPQRHDLAEAISIAQTTNEDGTTNLDVRDTYLAARAIIPQRLDARQFVKALCQRLEKPFVLREIYAVDHQIERPRIANVVIAAPAVVEPAEAGY